MGGFFGPQGTGSNSSSSSGGGFAGAEISASPAAGANNNFDPGGGWPGTSLAPDGVLILTDGGTPGACNLTGLKAGQARQLVTIINNRSNDVVLNDANAGSTAANRFATGGIDPTLPPGASINGVYSATLSRWVLQL